MRAEVGFSCCNIWISSKSDVVDEWIGGLASDEGVCGLASDDGSEVVVLIGEGSEEGCESDDDSERGAETEEESEVEVSNDEALRAIGCCHC